METKGAKKLKLLQKQPAAKNQPADNCSSPEQDPDNKTEYSKLSSYPSIIRRFSNRFGLFGVAGDFAVCVGFYILTLPSTLMMKAFRSNYRLWRFSAKRYLSTFDRMAYQNACWVSALAARIVPAYKSFLGSQKDKRCLKSLESFPETNKENYAKAYDFPSQCRHGDVKIIGTTVDESSGSSGEPFNWMRSRGELRNIHLDIANYIRLEFPSNKLFTLNAFSMGAWTTGVNVSKAATRAGIVKSIGPDINCIIQTLNTFGPGFDYLITAYPPFLKRLCDRLDANDFPWGRYTLYGLVGGEGITEALRDYLERRFRKVRSAYGASDLNISIGAETDFSVWLRRRLITDRVLRYRLLGFGEDRIPMIFQYNPFENYIETNDRSEVIITLNNISVLCPKIRYNIGDEGKIFRYSKLLKILKFYVPNWRSVLYQVREDLTRLPLLFLFGRKDNTVSYMGANIHPQDIEYGIFADEKYTRFIESFCLSLEEGENLYQSPTVNIQLEPKCHLQQEERDRMAETLKTGITRHLNRVSRDFARAVHEDPEGTQVHIRIYEYGKGIFSETKKKIKNQYLLKIKSETNPEAGK